MKHLYLFILPYFLLLVIIGSVSFACSKKITASIDNTMIGKWQFQFACGGFSGRDSIKATPDAVTVLFLNSDNTYSKMVNNQTVASGKYDFVNVLSIYTNKAEKAIRFDGIEGQLITLNEPELTLYDNHTEPYGFSYTRIK